jgi:hypothetical protein
MGIVVTNYVIFGFKIDTKKHNTPKINIQDDKFQPYTEGRKNVPYAIIYDCMSDEYIVFGKLVNTIHEYDGNSFGIINLQKLEYLNTTQLNEDFIQLFGQDVYDQLEEKEPQLLVFNHYS